MRRLVPTLWNGAPERIPGTGVCLRGDALPSKPATPETVLRRSERFGSGHEFASLSTASTPTPRVTVDVRSLGGGAAYPAAASLRRSSGVLVPGGVLARLASACASSSLSLRSSCWAALNSSRDLAKEAKTLERRSLLWESPVTLSVPEPRAERSASELTPRIPGAPSRQRGDARGLTDARGRGGV